MNCESRDVGFSHRTKRRKTDRTLGQLMSRMPTTNEWDKRAIEGDDHYQ